MENNMMNVAAVALYVMKGDKYQNLLNAGFKTVDEAELKHGQFCIIAEPDEEMLATACFVASNENQAIFSRYTKAEVGLEFSMHIEIPKSWVLVYPLEEAE